jgi:hypothetical protein
MTEKKMTLHERMNSMSREDFILWAKDNEDEVLNACWTRKERIIVKNALKLARLLRK